MTYQTKEMAIGYILKAMIDAGSKTKTLRDRYYKLDEVATETIEAYLADGKEVMFDNHTTNDLMIISFRELEISDKEIDDISRFLLSTFDLYTIEEAEEFYHAFKIILRVR